jgi:hypothetical protein
MERDITHEGMNMSAHCENDLNDDQYESNMAALELSIVQYVRVIGAQMHLTPTTQNVCLKRALLTVLMDLIEHEPCDQARGEILRELADEWNRRAQTMTGQNPATAH